MPTWLKTLLEAIGFAAKQVRPKDRPKPGPDVKPLDAEALKRKSREN